MNCGCTPLGPGGGGGAGVTSFNGRSGAVVPLAGDYTSTLVTNLSGVTGATVTDALNTLNTAVSGSVPTSLIISTTSPLRIAGGASADLSANRTLSVLAVTNTNSGVVPQTNGTLGQWLTAAAGAGAPTWGNDAGANNITTTGGYISNLGAGFLRIGLTPGSGAGSAASAGAIRLPLGAFVAEALGRNNSDNGDVFLWGWSSSGNVIQFGSNGAGGNATVDVSALTTMRVRLTTSATVVMSMTTTAVSYAGISSFTFDGPPTVTISQAAAVGAGKQLTVQAQNGTTTGGNLALVAGDGAAANAAGSVLLVPGKGAGLAGNLNILKATVPVFNGMQRGAYWADSEALPTASPVGGAYLYSVSGNGIARSINDTFTTLWAA